MVPTDDPTPPPGCPLQKPATLAEAVDQLVAQRLEEERAALAAHYQQLEAGLVGRLEALQAAAAPPAAPGKK